jgi:para-nitrobenzyl esterase
MTIRIPRRTFLRAGMVISAGLVSGAARFAAASAEEGGVVTTTAGKVRGLQDRGVQTFKGIPYGASTAGANRFMPPRAVEPWTGIFEAFHYGASAPQREPEASSLYQSEGRQPERDEDCLKLNVWTPSLERGARPVLVWWHGGGFESGSGSSIRTDGTNLCLRGDVVVVTVNHRLNVFGHCYLVDHLGVDYAESGNVGFLDLVASLQWVRDNIARFGGDPANVTIFGLSGGGRKVSLALAAAAAKGLFHRAIVQSGSHLRIQTQDQAAQHTDRLLHALNIRTANAPRLLTSPWQEIMAAQLKVSTEALLRFAPVIDGHVFEGHPWDPQAPAVSSRVPMLVGTTRTEVSSQLGSDEAVHRLDEPALAARLEHYLPREDVPSVIDTFKRTNPGASPTELFFLIVTARGYARDATIQIERRVQSLAAPAYRYCVEWRTPVEGGRRLSPHGLDTAFVFDNVAYATSMVGPVNERSTAMAAVMSESWIAFARSGDPNNALIPEWAPYNLERRTTMIFDDRSRAVDDPYSDERIAMERYPTQQQEQGRALHRTEGA